MHEPETRMCAGDHRHRPTTNVTLAIDTFLPVLGGVQTQLYRLTPLLEARGVHASVVTRRIPADAPRHERASHIEIVRVPCTRGDPDATRGFVAMAVARIVSERPDVVHARGLRASATAARIAARAIRRPYVLSVLTAGADGDVARLLAEPGGERRWRRIARTATTFVCVSGEAVRDLERAGIDRQRIVRIPNGVDIGHFRLGRPGDAVRSALRTSLGLPAEAPLSLTVGPLEAGKRIDRLIAAQAGVPGVLLVVGGGPEAPRLRAIANAAGLANRVLFRPPVDDVAPYMRCADVYVTAVNQGGLSNAVLEAMASGLPVVATPGPTVAELVDETTGVLVDAETPAAIGRALVALLEDPDRRRALGAAGRKRVVAGYALTRTADELVALYERLRR